METFEMKKRKALVKLAFLMDEDGFFSLRSLFVNSLPYSIDIKSPMELMHVLNLGDTLNLFELCHKLRSLGYRKEIEFLEAMVKEDKVYQANNISFVEYLHYLRDGLRSQDIESISFIQGYSTLSTNFSEILPILFMGIISDYYTPFTFIEKLSSIINDKQFIYRLSSDIKSNGASKYEKETKQLNLRPERELLFSISFDINNLDIDSLKFLFNLPVIIFEQITTPLTFFLHLEKSQLLDIGLIERYLILIGRIKLVKRVSTAIMHCKSNSYNKTSTPIYNHTYILWIINQTKNFFINNFEYELSLKLFENLITEIIADIPTHAIDISSIISILISLERHDLISNISKIKGINIKKEDLPEGASYTKEENRLLHLKYKLDTLMVSELCKLYKIKKGFCYVGEFLTYLIVHGLADIDLLKKNLSIIGQGNLIYLLNCYDE